MFNFQHATVDRALKLGKSALFANTGLGKGFQELAWAEAVCQYTDSPVLLVAPLAVSKQFKREAQKIGLSVNICESQVDVTSGINITNYEKLHKFEARSFSGIVCDESSLLKGNGKLARSVIDFASVIDYRLAATATPSPNDYQEFGMQAEFLGVMTQQQMLATFFTHDGGNTSVWRLKKWGEDKFWQWVSSWATVYRMPSDIGYSDDGFVLPPLIDHHHAIESTLTPEDGALFVSVASMSDRRRARRESLADRINHAAELINSDRDSWLVWCELNDEADELLKLVPDAKQVAGSQSPEEKERILNEFSDGDLRVLVSKPSICGSGMNWQHCRNVLFVGINDSYESLYQATNRVYRFGQKREVHRHLVFSEHEWVVFDNLQRKAQQADRMWSEVGKYFSTVLRPTDRHFIDYKPSQKLEIPSWLLK
ncbi:MAG TPA: DEAD/DEAH box helicase [Coleofasciculaceae cyanobacterium]